MTVCQSAFAYQRAAVPVQARAADPRQPDLEGSRRQLRQNAAGVRAVHEVPVFERGHQHAGRIIEVVSGMSYESFLDKRLLEPLGMKDTTFWPSEAQVKRLASATADKAKSGLEATTIAQLKYPLSDRKRQPMPAGGLFSHRDRCRPLLPDGSGRRRLRGQTHSGIGGEVNDPPPDPRIAQDQLRPRRQPAAARSATEAPWPPT